MGYVVLHFLCYRQNPCLIFFIFIFIDSKIEAEVGYFTKSGFYINLGKFMINNHPYISNHSSLWKKNEFYSILYAIDKSHVSYFSYSSSSTQKSRQQLVVSKPLLSFWLYPYLMLDSHMCKLGKVRSTQIHVFDLRNKTLVLDFHVEVR
jgi:hypothetical protein